jgi:hypothetical protein
MIFSHEDPIVKEKHEVQKGLLLKAKGDLSRYNRIIRTEAVKIKGQARKKAELAAR